jgi:protocatechuate 3,4-dioxygenase beta subunit
MKCKLAVWMLAAASLSAQITVQAGKQTQIPASGATAAVSLDAHVADASVENGVLTILGVDPGDTRVIAFDQTGLQEILVHVTPGTPVYPPGFVAPPNPDSESDSYEFRFSSDRLQFENILDLFSRQTDRTTQLHVVSATFAGQPDRASYVPSAYYRVTTPDSDITLLDQTVNDSPLTLQNVILRGLHFKDDGWQFHGGYTASADFADVFIPVEKEFAAGVSYTEVLKDYLKIIPSLYFLRSIDLADGQQRSGLIASLLLDIDFSPDWRVKSEIAYGRGIAFAGELAHSSPATKLSARLTKKDLDFPTVRSNSLPGLSADASWSQVLTNRMGLLSGATINHIDLNTIQQDSQSAYTSLRYRISHSWSAATGISYGSFSRLGYYSARTLTLPQQINFDRTRFGAGFQYQFATASDSFSSGAGFRETLRLTLGRFQIGGFLDSQKDALSIESLYSQIPGLQQELQRLGMTAVTPDQLATLLQNAAFLRLLGFSSQAQIVTVPRRLQEGASVIWNSIGARPHQLSLSYIESHNEFETSASTDYNFTGSYSKAIGASNQVQFSASVVKSDFIGQQQLTQVISASFRHTFSHAPAILSLQRNTSIKGTVFIDARRLGVYENGMKTVARATVRLDGVRTTMTNSGGDYHFGGVSPGSHTIELQYASDRQHYFTTPQNTVTEGGSTVDFGIAFPATDLWGYIKDDAGDGLENIKLQITGASGNQVISTDSNGKFTLPDIQPGSYQIQVNPESVPMGYAPDDLIPVQVNITVNSASHPVIELPAIRILTGSVTIYDAAAGSYVPLKGAVVSIPKLARSMITNDSGRFIFGRLPAGDLEVTVVAGPYSCTHTINVPTHPVTLTDDFKVSLLSGKIAFTLTTASN